MAGMSHHPSADDSGESEAGQGAQQECSQKGDTNCPSWMPLNFPHLQASYLMNPHIRPFTVQLLWTVIASTAPQHHTQVQRAQTNRCACCCGPQLQVQPLSITCSFDVHAKSGLRVAHQSVVPNIRLRQVSGVLKQLRELCESAVKASQVILSRSF
jgi:hypothetical protein